MNIKVIKSARRTISLEITPELDVILRAPYLTSRREIERFLDSKSDWINKTVRRMERRKAADDTKGLKPISDDETSALARKAKEVIPPKVKYFADIIGVDYGRITIRNQKTRWGSCSAKHNLNFNCLLLKAPEEILDYVIVHELCHIIEMNHSKDFWAQVEKVLPDYKARRKWLRDNGDKLFYSYKDTENTDSKDGQDC